MTIRKGEAWGTRVDAVTSAPRAATDRDAAARLWEQRRSGVSAPVVALTGGETWALLGGASIAGRVDTTDAMAFPIDVGIVVVAGVEVPFLGSAVARTRSWRHGIAVMNGQSTGGLRLGHRAHPNDGLLDVVTWDLRLGELWKVRKRARLGAHTPHPSIAERRVPELDVDVPEQARLSVDGIDLGSVTRLIVRVVPDAGNVVL